MQERTQQEDPEKGQYLETEQKQGTNEAGNSRWIKENQRERKWGCDSRGETREIGCVNTKKEREKEKNIKEMEGERGSRGKKGEGGRK